MSLLPRPLVRLLLVEAATAAAIALLARPCRPATAVPGERLTRASLANLVPALGWWVAAAITGWLIATTIVCVASRALPWCSPLRRVEWLGAAVVSRYVDAAFVVGLSIGTITATSGAAMAAPALGTSPPVTVEVQSNGTLVVVPPTTAPTTANAPTPTTSTTTAPIAPRRPQPAPAPQSAPPAAPPAAARRASVAPPSLTTPDEHVTVRTGDNLWRIAASHLANRRGRPVHDGEIVPYWRAVIAANRTTFRSGDPNLIYPGELVTLPALPAAE